MKRFLYLLGIFMCLLLSCAETNIQLRTIPTSHTGKLRIFVIPLSKKVSETGEQILREFLKKGDIYEVVGEEEVKTVINKRDYFSLNWKKDNYNLTREVGKHLNAEYGLVIYRFVDIYTNILFLTLINIESGKQFTFQSRKHLSQGEYSLFDEFVLGAYTGLFKTAEGDMFTPLFFPAKSLFPSMKVARGILH